MGGREGGREREREEEREEAVVIGGHKFKHPSAAKVLLNEQLLNSVLFSLNIAALI
jgi:hypothetical protein